MTSREADRTGELSLIGRIRTASNATFLAQLGEDVVVYKPVAGERPLWDFPDGTLADREVAAFEVSEALGWDIVPPTRWQDGPHGPGMVQRWRQPAEDSDAVLLVPVDELPEQGWCHVLDGLDENERPVSLLHEDSAAVRRIAVFDVLVNNADRKGAHLLPMADGHRYGVDHGLTFHTEHKLRTILWGWSGRPLTAQEAAGVTALLDACAGDLGQRLAALLDEAEVEAFRARCAALLAAGVLPAPRPDGPAIPWPPL